MARKNNIEDLIHCNVCGEDYSSTYRRCPFCGERADTRAVSSSDDDFDDGYVFDGQALFDDEPADEQASTNKGGKRLAASGSKNSGRPVAPPKKKKSGPYDAPGAINWVRLITFGISLVIIIAALIIVFTVIYPKLHNPDTPPTEPNTPPGVTDVDPNDPPTEPNVPPEEPPVEPAVPDAPLNSLTMKSKNDYDFTLKVGESHTPTPVLDPVDWDGTLTWTSSDVTFATVDANGTVTNVNKTTALRRVIITVSGGGQEVEITVYCRGTDADPDAPPVDPDAPTGLAPGAKGRITGAAGGLRVRGGPGTTYEILASLVNGNQVTILQDAGNGWYKISYSGGNGEATGYIMGEYIAVN